MAGKNFGEHVTEYWHKLDLYYRRQLSENQHEWFRLGNFATRDGFALLSIGWFGGQFFVCAAGDSAWGS